MKRWDEGTKGSLILYLVSRFLLPFVTPLRNKSGLSYFLYLFISSSKDPVQFSQDLLWQRFGVMRFVNPFKFFQSDLSWIPRVSTVIVLVKQRGEPKITDMLKGVFLH